MIALPDAEVAVIGAGPAGLMAADRLASAGCRVALYDRMPSAGRKFLLAGRGGLNLTHAEDADAFGRRYREAAETLRASLDAFDAAALRLWSEQLGQPTFVGTSGRVFPQGFKTSPLLRALLTRLSANGVVFHASHLWRGWTTDGSLVFDDRTGRPVTIRPAATVLALGGASWPQLGSDGGWATVLEDAGIAVAKLRPANCGFTVRWTPHFSERFAGVALKRIALGFGGETIRGEAVITRDGIEGGAIYALSAPIRDALQRGDPVSGWVDLRPDLDEAALSRRLAAPRRGASLSNHLRKSAGLAPVAIGLLREAVGTLPAAPERLAALIKRTPLMFDAPRSIERAISSAGGVLLDECDEHWMLHRKPGVFVAGEMLDWEAPTGGYLLQACFSTAMRAADGMLAFLERGAILKTDATLKTNG